MSGSFLQLAGDGSGEQGFGSSQGGRMLDDRSTPCHAQPREPHAGGATGWQHGLVLGLGDCWRPTEAQAPFSAVSQHLSIPSAFLWLQAMAMLELLQGWSHIRTLGPWPHGAEEVTRGFCTEP